MQGNLDKDRKVIMRQWATREPQIDRVMPTTVGMYGDLQGIAGKTLPEIEDLGFDALEGPDSDATDGSCRVAVGSDRSPSGPRRNGLCSGCISEILRTDLVWRMGS